MTASSARDDAARACRDLTRRSGTSFYYPLLLLKRRKREAIMAVYAFCRQADDLADDPALGEGEGPAAERRRRIAAWREELDLCFDGRPTHPITTALAEAVREFSIPKEPFEELLLGVEMDTHVRRYATFEDLRTYCYRVASTVGLMCVEIFGYTGEATREYAVDLGLALQLTNILRDLRADAARDRIYLPQEDLERFGVSEQQILDGKRTLDFERMMEFECARARSLYRKAWGAQPPEDRRSLVVADAIGRIYYELLLEIEARHYDVYREKVRLPRWRKMQLAAGVWSRCALRLPREWPPRLRNGTA